MIPFSEQYDLDKERLIIKKARSGSQQAAGELIKLHQRFIYNVALKFAQNSDDAKDLTQDVLIKMLTKLKQFEFKSSFRTWLYRITANHFLASKRKRTESEASSFEELGEILDTLYDHEIMSIEEQQKYSDQITVLRNRCTSSMLLCLDRDQRIILILGSIFNIKAPSAAKVLGITPANFRKQLSRAKADLNQFMSNKCGLINPENPCRCHKKVKGFIKDGIVDSETRQFTADAVETIASVAFEKNRDLDKLIGGKYLSLLADQPYQRADNENELVTSLLLDPEVKTLFLLN
jgi:RNA polymerase sigma factor (sigma-70 family)